VVVMGSGAGTGSPRPEAVGVLWPPRVGAASRRRINLLNPIPDR